MTRPSCSQTALLLEIALALDDVTATVIIAAAAVATKSHAIPGGVIPAADSTGVVAEEGLIPVIHHDHGPPGGAIVGPDLAEGTDLIAEAGLDPHGGTPVVDLILLIVNVPGVPQNPLTGSNVN